MASIRDAIARNKARIAAGGETGTGVGPQATANIAPTPPQDLPVGNGLPQRGMFSADLVLASDRSDSSRAFRGQGTRSAAFPYQIQGIKKAPTIVVPATSAAAAALALSLETNGLPNPNQDLLNLVQGANISIVANPDGSVVITGSGGDGLIHGDPIWDVDSAVVRLYDDFMQFNVNGASFTSNFTSALPWGFTGSPTNGQFVQWTGVPPYMGQILFGAGSVAYNGSATACAAMYPFSDASGSNIASAGWSLVENPSWKLVWNFGIGRSYNIFNQGATQPPAFSWTQVSFYLGLGNTQAITGAPTPTVSPRPNNFIGLRYDTDPGVTYTLSAVANASGGNTVYTGTITNGGSNAFLGQTFLVTGFANPLNNGTFVCMASTAGTLTLNNPSGVAVTGAGSAAAKSTNDNQFVFEAVSNYNFSTQRNNTQGSTVQTGITATEGGRYRFEMTCTTAGSITMTLTDGTTLFTSTLTVPTTSFPAPPLTLANQTLPGFIDNNLAIISNAGTPGMPFVPGSKITSSGWSGALVSLNGIKTLIAQGSSGQISFLDVATGTGPTAQSATVVGYPAVAPWFGFGNDSSASPTAATKAVLMDAFEFVWNLGVAGLGSATPNPVLSRYF